MKKIVITYWITTSIVALMMIFSGIMYLTAQEAKDGFIKLGFPDFFRIELAVAKIIGAIVLLAPICARVKEWAYAGFAIVFVSAVVAHLASGDTIAHAMMPVVFAGILVVSYLTYHQKRERCCKDEKSEEKCCS